MPPDTMDGTTTSLPIVNMVTPQPDINIEREVLRVTSGISEKFVTAPTRSSSLSDLLIGLKRYKNSIRWKEYFIINKENSDQQNKNNDNNSKNDAENSTINLSDVSSSSLNTSLKPKNRQKNAPVGTPQLEVFFDELEK